MKMRSEFLETNHECKTIHTIIKQSNRKRYQAAIYLDWPALTFTLKCKCILNENTKKFVRFAFLFCFVFIRLFLDNFRFDFVRAVNLNLIN